MSKFRIFYAATTLLLAGMFAGCHSDIDLTKIDPKAEVDLGMALPVGSVHATIGDFLGTGVGNFYVDSLDNKGVITWKDTFKIARNFHQMDLAQYISEKQLNLNVYDKIPAATMIGTNKQITGTGTQAVLKFDMPLKLTGINKSATLNDERLDSALIEMASFSSIINTHNLPLEWDWIDMVTLELGEQIKRPAGNTMTVYDKNVDHYGYGQNIPTKVDNFTINLIKDGIVGQVIDSCNFIINFYFTVPLGQTVLIPEDAGFDYKLGVQFIDYSAIWGKFSRSKDMYDENVIDVSKSWGSFDFITRCNVPFADPKIDMYIVTQVAGAMKVDGDYLYSEDANGTKHYASFKYGATTKQDFHKQFQSHEYLDPNTSAIGDSTTNMMIVFDKDPERGHIDELFQNMPQKLGYKFGVDFSYGGTFPNQIRITPNTSISINAVCTLPLIFNNGVSLNYTDTLRDINLSQYSIDSLLGEVKVIDTLKATDVHVVLTANNSIPLDVRAAMRCLDQYGNILMDPADPTKPLLLFKQDTITLQAPTYDKQSGSWVQVQPGVTTIEASLTKAELDMFPQIKNIIYTAIIDDQSLQQAYSRGMENIRLTSDQGLTFKIGLTAQVDAILDFNQQNTNK